MLKSTNTSETAAVYAQMPLAVPRAQHTCPPRKLGMSSESCP